MSISRHLTIKNAERAEELAARLAASIAGVDVTDIAQPEHMVKHDIGALLAFADQARGGRARLVFTLVKALRLIGVTQ